MRSIERFILALAALGLIATAALASPASAANRSDWSMFGWNLARSSAPDVSMGINASNLYELQHQQVRINGVVDSAAIYLQGVTVKGARHDAFFVTTIYGQTLAINADNGEVLWEFTPPSYNQLKGSHQVTNSTPVADPDGKFIYAASPDGMIRKLSVADGKLEWSTSITRLPVREKIPSPLAYYKGRIIVTTNGYNGDDPPYQGHIAVLNARSGKLLHVWNALCSSRTGLLDPTTCPQSDAGIWGRAGAVIDAKTGNIFVATGNALWDGKEYWGDSVIELNPDATEILGNYTPENTAYLNENDLDLGSTSPVLTGGPYIIQGGKGGVLHVLDWHKMASANPHRGGEASRTRTPGGAMLFTAPAVWHDDDATWIYVADFAGTTAFQLQGSRLEARWQNHNAGTSPVVADGLVFVYDPEGALYIYDATSGRELDKLECGRGHWSSPIVADGRIVLGEGNANARKTRGVLDIWRLPKR